MGHNPYSEVFALNRQYIVHFKKLTDDRFMVGDTDLQLDTRYNRMHHATERTTVLAAPKDGDIFVGDELIVQYLVVEEKNRLGRDS